MLDPNRLWLTPIAALPPTPYLLLVPPTPAFTSCKVHLWVLGVGSEVDPALKQAADAAIRRSTHFYIADVDLQAACFRQGIAIPDVIWDCRGISGPNVSGGTFTILSPYPWPLQQ